MICFIALGVFAVLAFLSLFGVVSPKYRVYFTEAFDCVFRKMTLRKCTTSFDKKMKMKIATRISLKNKQIGGFIFKHFESLSSLLTILMILSLVWSAYTSYVAVYNWVAYGNCNGPDSTQVCVLNNITGRVQPNTVVSITTPLDVNALCDANALLGAPGK